VESSRRPVDEPVDNKVIWEFEGWDFNEYMDNESGVLGHKSFAKPIPKTGLLRVILYYLNHISPPKNT
jgi:hypothetical protein